MCDRCADAAFQLDRSFATPLDTLYEAFANPTAFSEWFSPTGSKTTLLHFDLRKGGFLHARMEGPQGATFARFDYTEVTPQARLVWIHGFADADGNRVAHPMAPGWPLTLLSEVGFSAATAGQAVLSLRWTPHQASPEETHIFSENLAGMYTGWTDTLDRLGGWLAAH